MDSECQYCRERRCLEHYRRRPLKTAFYLSFLFFLLGPRTGIVAVLVTALAGLAFAARRQRVTRDEGGLRARSLFGLAAHYVPYSQIDHLVIEDQELVARDARGRALCRSREGETAEIAESFSELQARVDEQQRARTGFERDGRALADWLGALDTALTRASSGVYRGQPVDFGHAVAVFQDPRRAPDARAGAAWVLLRNEDLDHRALVLRSLGPSLPPIVLAVCALGDEDEATTRLARQGLRFLPRVDRREWVRLLAKRRVRVASPARARIERDRPSVRAEPEEGRLARLESRSW